MVVDQKVEEAEYFLDKIEKATEREDFIPNLSAFLSATRSIPDYLLEDYNVKYGLEIPLDKRLQIDVFQQAAAKQKNQIALAFIKKYREDFEKLNKDEIGHLLMSKRNIKVHRTDTPLQENLSVTIPEEALDIRDSVTVIVNDKYGNIKTSSDSRDESNNMDEKDTKPESNNKQSIEHDIEITYYFHDYNRIDVVESCQQFLQSMKDFVQKLRTDFP